MLGGVEEMPSWHHLQGPGTLLHAVDAGDWTLLCASGCLSQRRWMLSGHLCAIGGHVRSPFVEIQAPSVSEPMPASPPRPANQTVAGKSTEASSSLPVLGAPVFAWD